LQTKFYVRHAHGTFLVDDTYDWAPPQTRFAAAAATDLSGRIYLLDAAESQLLVMPRFLAPEPVATLSLPKRWGNPSVFCVDSGTGALFVAFAVPYHHPRSSSLCFACTECGSCRYASWW
jgi:hypothetical protein